MGAGASATARTREGGGWGSGDTYNYIRGQDSRGLAVQQLDQPARMGPRSRSPAGVGRRRHEDKTATPEDEGLGRLAAPSSSG